MSDELKVQIPAGYRWVNVGETRSSEIWLSADHGRWKPVPIIFGHMEHEFTYITPIEPPKRSGCRTQKVVGNSRCPKCGRKSLVVEKDGWDGAKSRTVCAFAGCAEVVNDAE